MLLWTIHDGILSRLDGSAHEIGLAENVVRLAMHRAGADAETSAENGPYRQLVGGACE